ncbi:MAG: RNA methyltransferase [Bacteroidales bacterium]
MEQHNKKLILPELGRGYFGIGYESIVNKKNIGTLWRSAHIMGASFIFLIGRKYEMPYTDTMRSWKHIPLFEYKDLNHLRESLPKDSKLIGVELDERSLPLTTYQHPERALYLLGAEDYGLSKEALNLCDEIIQLPGNNSLNVAVAGSIVIYDRLLKKNR